MPIVAVFMICSRKYESILKCVNTTEIAEMYDDLFVALNLMAKGRLDNYERLKFRHKKKQQKNKNNRVDPQRKKGYPTDQKKKPGKHDFEFI